MPGAPRVPISSTTRSAGRKVRDPQASPRRRGSMVAANGGKQPPSRLVMCTGNMPIGDVSIQEFAYPGICLSRNLLIPDMAEIRLARLPSLDAGALHLCCHKPCTAPARGARRLMPQVPSESLPPRRRAANGAGSARSKATAKASTAAGRPVSAAASPAGPAWICSGVATRAIAPYPCR
jgi:hypothetical protein